MQTQASIYITGPREPITLICELWTSNHFTAKGHTHYCELAFRPHVEK